jgi:hypothetical protein
MGIIETGKRIYEMLTCTRRLNLQLDHVFIYADAAEPNARIITEHN